MSLRSSLKFQLYWISEKKMERRKAAGAASAGRVKPLKRTLSLAHAPARVPSPRFTLSASAPGSIYAASRSSLRISRLTFGKHLSARFVRRPTHYWCAQRAGTTTWCTMTSPKATSWCSRACRRRRTTRGLFISLSRQLWSLRSSSAGAMSQTCESTTSRSRAATPL